MTVQKFFIISLITTVLSLFAMYSNVKQSAVNVNMNIPLNDEIMMGMALFITYLLLSSLYPKKAPSSFTKRS
ncbi:hypothetical protein [Nitrosomonas supralitoralis]|uniref:Uncharacterized protein n=1 Tax=Nitrosomonas supralitoralis TaxID=2116706 RepID=A0A2P7NTB2_9PROT|nr:hypothetical protein [Nitrosomonas supralitoralis]PSJ16713.1 hypothetical protein C7H79_11865 [Nitrosomonas supralitoralis]